MCWCSITKQNEYLNTQTTWSLLLQHWFRLPRVTPLSHLPLFYPSDLRKSQALANRTDRFQSKAIGYLQMKLMSRDCNLYLPLLMESFHMHHTLRQVGSALRRFTDYNLCSKKAGSGIPWLPDGIQMVLAVYMKWSSWWATSSALNQEFSIQEKENSNLSLHSLAVCTSQSEQFYGKLERSSLSSKSFIWLTTSPSPWLLRPILAAFLHWHLHFLAEWFRVSFLYSCPKINEFYIYPYR